MPALAPVVLISWIFVTIILFLKYSPQKAIVISVFGGMLFLPVYDIELFSFLTLNKSSVIALGIILGELLSGSRREFLPRYSIYDIPILLWCFLSPELSSISNGYGVTGGISPIISNYLSWGVFYWTGKRYFINNEHIQTIIKAFIFGGLAYLPLILYEERFSPRLNINIYGYFAHVWRQHKRYGGWRPIVFMEHGIMVALFMVCVSLVFFWLWRSGKISKIKNISISFITIILIIATVLCRVAAGWAYLLFGVLLFSVYKKKNSVFLLKTILLLIPVYMALRINQFISSESIGNIAASIFDDERAGSLGLRLLQEDLFTVKAMQRPFLGWFGLSRAWPVNIETGRVLVKMIDSFWMIIFTRYGLLALFSVYIGIGIGPFLILLSLEKRTNHISIELVLLCLIVILFMVDTLLNGMINQMYIMVSGSLLGYYLANKQKYDFQDNQIIL